MERNPRVGLVLIRAEACGIPEAREVEALIRADVETITARLQAEFDLQGPWIVDGPEALPACQRALREAAPDMVVLAYLTEASEDYLAGLLEAVGGGGTGGSGGGPGGCPLVLWCYTPWRRFPPAASFADVLRGSGPVGAFGALGALRNQGAAFFFTFGAPDDPRLIEDLRRAGRAAGLRRALRAARIGLLPSQERAVQSAFVDRQRLAADFGPAVVEIPAEAFQQAAGALPQARVEAYAGQLRQGYPGYGISDQALEAAARGALGLAGLAAEHGLDVLAVSESPVPGCADGQHPALYPVRLGPAGGLYLPAAELCPAAASYILNHLTGSPVMLLEPWFWDQPKNVLVGGHLGMQNPALAAPGKVSLGPYRDLRNPAGCEGVQFEFIARAGRVTLFQMRGTPGGWQAVAASGVCLEGQPLVQGYPHAQVRLDAPVDHFFHQVAAVGAARHWTLAYGSVLADLESFCQMSGVPLEVFR